MKVLYYLALCPKIHRLNVLRLNVQPPYHSHEFSYLHLSS